MATSRYLDLPTLPHGPNAQRASLSFTSISSASSFCSAGFDQDSKSSQLTDLTPLITPLDSVDSIFGDDPDFEKLPHSSDPLGWDMTDKQWKLQSLISKAEYAFASLDSGNDLELGSPPHLSDPVGLESLTDEEWNLRSLISRAECAIMSEHRKARSQMSKAEHAIKQVELAILKTLDQACLLKDTGYVGNLLHTDYEGFDAVAAARAKLMKGEQTTVTRRALEIMDQRSGLALKSIEDRESVHDAPAATVNDVEKIEDYAEDFELDDNDVLEVPTTPAGSGINYFINGDSTLETIDEVDDDMEDWMHHAIPLRDATVFVIPPTPLIRPLDVWDSPSFSTSETNVSVSRLTMSPLVLNDPTISHGYFENTATASGSPMIPVSPFPSKGRPPFPWHLDETLDVAEVVELKTAANHPNGQIATETSIQSTQDLGLENGLIPTAGPWLQIHYGSPLVAESMMKAITSGIYGSSFEMNSFGIEVESPANSEPERNQRRPFEPEKSPPLEFSSGLTNSITHRETLEGISAENDIVHAGPVSNFSPAMATTTVITASNLPAASTSLGSPVMENQNERFSLRFATGLKQLLSRHSEILTSEARQSMANFAPPIKDKARLRRLRRRKSIQGKVESTAPPCLPLEAGPESFQTKPRNFFKKALNFLF